MPIRDSVFDVVAGALRMGTILGMRWMGLDASWLNSWFLLFIDNDYIDKIYGGPASASLKWTYGMDMAAGKWLWKVGDLDQGVEGGMGI